MFRITELETLDTAFYRCEASNALGDTVKSVAIVRVNLGSLGTLPRNFPPLQPGAFPGGLNGQPTNIEFEGRSPESMRPGGGNGKGCKQQRRESPLEGHAEEARRGKPEPCP